MSPLTAWVILLVSTKLHSQKILASLGEIVPLENLGKHQQGLPCLTMVDLLTEHPNILFKNVCVFLSFTASPVPTVDL